MNQKHAHKLLHTLWSKANGPEYNKRDWIALEVAVTRDPPDAAASSLFAGLREIAARDPSYREDAWDEFEHTLFGSVRPRPLRSV